MGSVDIYIYPEFVKEYIYFHRMICFTLNKMIWNIAFLKAADIAQEKFGSCENDYAISFLVENEFELLTLRLNKVLFDQGSDVISIGNLKKNLLTKYLRTEYRDALKAALEKTSWNAPEIIAIRKRIEPIVKTFRKNFIAHLLNKDTNEQSVKLCDIERIVLCACDYFSKLNFGAEEFYIGMETGNLNHAGEIIVCNEFAEKLFMYLSLGSQAVSEIKCSYILNEYTQNVKKAIEEIDLIIQKRLQFNN